VFAEVSFTLAAIVTVVAAAWLSRRRGSWQPLIYTDLMQHFRGDGN
jgi:hypothetical protein